MEDQIGISFFIKHSKWLDKIMSLKPFINQDYQ